MFLTEHNKNKKNKMNKDNNLDREEFGYGFDISPDDMDVIGKNRNVKKTNNTKEQNEQQRPPTNK